MEWEELKAKAERVLYDRGLSEEYSDRLTKECYEIVKQGANEYWLEQYNSDKKWDSNPNGLVLPWLLGMTPVDPVAEGIPHIEVYQTDYPDIDLDYIPLARSTIKEYAMKKYIHVCSVGYWITYKPKSALQDATRALGGDVNVVLKFSTTLPDEFDDLTWEDHLKNFANLKSPDKDVRMSAHTDIAKFQAFYEFREANPEIVDLAFRLVGKIKAQGTHAGGLIIADRPINNIVPMSYMGGAGNKAWTSQWTEGRKTQLSKFGLVKFDILGVKTVFYIWQAGNLIEQTRGVRIDWSRMDPLADEPYAGVKIYPDGTEELIPLNDKAALEQCNNQKVASVFQIETPIQKAIISDGKVRSFADLVAYNALGRPGPMDYIGDYLKNRDDEKEGWRDEDPRITKILKDTYNIIVFQEQLQALWVHLAGFTTPEAEAARKIIAKKWVDKLPQIEEKWKRGASRTIGKEAADDWWTKMTTFGRYAFNRSHALAYSLITYRCLYLKLYYPEEWWAAVMTECPKYKLAQYMSAAKMERVKFGSLDINSLSHEYSVRDGRVIPGLMSVKGVGEEASKRLVALLAERGEAVGDIDQVVALTGRDKRLFERLIKLGAFDKIHPNRRSLWVWYQYKYGSGKTVVALKKALNSRFVKNWSEEEITAQRRRFAESFLRDYPGKKLPKRITEWKPKVEKIVLKREQIIPLFEDYTSSERLRIEKELLGFYWSSPLDSYLVHGHSIESAKIKGQLEAVVESMQQKRAKKTNNVFYVLRVTDGVQSADVTIWEDVFKVTDPRTFELGVGISLDVEYNEERKAFRIRSGAPIFPLIRKDSPEALALVDNQDNEQASDDEVLW